MISFRNGWGSGDHTGAFSFLVLSCSSAWARASHVPVFPSSSHNNRKQPWDGILPGSKMLEKMPSIPRKALRCSDWTGSVTGLTCTVPRPPGVMR